MADVIAICGRCIIPQGILFLIVGRCHCLFLADVIAMVHDRVVVMVLWQMLLPYVCLFYGRCYCHVVFGRCCCPILCGRC